MIRENLFSGFLTKEDPKQSAQLQRLSILFKLCMKKLRYHPLQKRITKVLISQWILKLEKYLHIHMGHLVPVNPHAVFS